MLLYSQIALDFVSVKEISLSTGCSPRTITRWIRQGRLPFVRFGRRYLVPVKAYKRFLADHSFKKN